jgi:hypothetical protein
VALDAGFPDAPREQMTILTACVENRDAVHGGIIVDSRQSTVISRQSTVDSRQSSVGSHQSTVVSRQRRGLAALGSIAGAQVLDESS